MIFAENNEIVCERKVNVIYIYIDIYKEWIQSRTLKKDKITIYHFSTFIFTFLPLDCNLKHTYMLSF